MQKVLDYNSPSANGYPGGDNVAAVLADLSDRYRAALTQQAFDAIDRDTADLSQHPSQPMAVGIRGVHRLARFKRAVPIYAACFAEGGERWDDMLARARLALLLHLYGPTDAGPEPSTYALSDFCRNWRTTPASQNSDIISTSKSRRTFVH